MEKVLMENHRGQTKSFDFNIAEKIVQKGHLKGKMLWMPVEGSGWKAVKGDLKKAEVKPPKKKEEKE